MKSAVSLSAFLLFLAHSANAVSSLAEQVDPLIGVAGLGSCMPGPCLPHASIYPSPETFGAPPVPSGYAFGTQITGFAQLHTQGTGGAPSYGNFLISPQVGLDLAEHDHQSPAAGEQATSSAYNVRLTRYGIDCGVTPSRHCALYRFAFPASKQASIVIDVARKIGASTALQEGNVSIDPKSGTITGGGTFTGNWVPGSYKLYFCARFNKPLARHGVWKGEDDAVPLPASGEKAAPRPAIQTRDLHPQEGVDSAEIKTRSPLGAYAGFDTEAGEVVEMKIGVSFRSTAQAAHWLDVELPGWDFDTVKAAAAAEWNKALGAVSLDPATPPEEARKFYTALWHSFVQPRDRTNDGVRHGVGDAEEEPAFWDDHYTLWDTWKTLFPLLTLVDPQTVRGNIRSFVERYHAGSGDGGGVLVGSAFVAGNEYRVGQGGDEVDNIIADACVKDIGGIDWQSVYPLLKFDAEHARTDGYRTRGYVAAGDPWPYDKRMHSGSGTLGFAYNDFCVAEVARTLGKAGDAEKYGQRARNWRNVWDADARDGEWVGFVRSRREDGTFLPTTPRQGYNTDFYEGTCWEYSYLPTYDVPGLVEKMGGREQFTKRLLFALEHGLIDFGNEPSFMTVWLFDCAGRPYLCSRWADVLRRKYGDRSLPGDDDSGAMSSLYCFLTAGLFPFAGQDIYYLHGVRVPRVEFHLESGRTFAIVGKHTGPENIYVQSATLNGKPLDEPVIHHREIVAGGTLEFEMGPKPGAWGCGGGFDAATAELETRAEKSAPAR